MPALVTPPGLSISEPEVIIETATQSRERRHVALACRELSNEIKIAFKHNVDQLGSHVKGMQCELDVVNGKLDSILSILKTEAVAVAMNLDYSDTCKVQSALGMQGCMMAPVATGGHFDFTMAARK